MIDAELSLIQATAQGDQKAFEQLIKRYQNPVVNFIYRYLGDRDAAEDLTQEVFLRVYQAAHRFEPRALVSSWIFKIAYHLSLNEIRRRSRFANLTRNAPFEAEETADSGSDELAACHELEEEVMAAVNELPDNQRVALLLKVNEGLSYREISETLQVSIASVESLLFRARQNVKKCLAKENNNWKGVNR